MRIMVYGDDSPGSGGWCYAETLRDMGHEVAQYSDWKYLEHYLRSLGARIFYRVAGRPRHSDRRRHVAGFLNHVAEFKPELVIVQKGKQLGLEDIQALRKLGCWVCNINHDDFFSLNPNNRSRLQRGAIPAYHYVFTTREINVEEIRPLNSNVEFFPFAYYPRIHRVVPIPAGEESQWGTDVVFVGTYEPARAAALEYLVQHVEARLSVHGTQWEKLPRNWRLRQCVRSGGVRFESMAKALGGAKIALGFLRKENRDDYTQRTFEIPACGGVLLAERTVRQQTFFKEGVEAEFFDANSPEELCRKVRMLLDDDGRRELIRLAGRTALARQKHTYQDRLNRLLEVFAARTASRN